MANIEMFTGLSFAKVEGMVEGSDEVIFTTTSGEVFEMYHQQDCCEDVWLEDVCGDVDDIINSKIIHFDVRTQEGEGSHEFVESATWTFYDIQTEKGSVNLRWVGESNGYYSESVQIDLVVGRD